MRDAGRGLVLSSHDGALSCLGGDLRGTVYALQGIVVVQRQPSEMLRHLCDRCDRFTQLSLQGVLQLDYLT